MFDAHLLIGSFMPGTGGIMKNAQGDRASALEEFTGKAGK